GTGQFDDGTVGARHRYAVEGVVRIVGRVVIRARRYYRAVQVRRPCRAHAAKHAAEESTVGVERQPEVRVRIRQAADRVVQARHHVARQPELLVAGGAQEIELPTFLADQYVGTRNIRAARQVEADERNFSGAHGRDVAWVLQQGRQVTGQCGKRLPGIREKA